ncbi:MAG: hypothetical protein HC836_22770 [Richelia sp. RM2_1_2]|nr:hypothetical protein [Richelia sp. RM2_1_2]
MEIKNLSKRSEEQKIFLRKHITDPVFLENYLDAADLTLLQSIYTQPIDTTHHDSAVSKHQIRFAKGSLRSELDHWVNEKFGKFLGNYTVDRIFGSTSESPTQIHTDSINIEDEAAPHKNIMIPLSVNGHTNMHKDWNGCQTIYFDQVWLERCGRSLFKKGYKSDNAREDIEVFDYSALDNVSNSIFPIDFYIKYLTHIPYAHCVGLSPLFIANWMLGSPVLFDRNRLHTSNNYTITGVKWKRFVCVFTNHATNNT